MIIDALTSREPWNESAEKIFIPASNESSGCLQTFGDCREGQIPRPLGRFKFNAPLLAAGFLTMAANHVMDMSITARSAADIYYLISRQ